MPSSASPRDTQGLNRSGKGDIRRQRDDKHHNLAVTFPQRSDVYGGHNSDIYSRQDSKAAIAPTKIIHPHTYQRLINDASGGDI